MKHEDGQFYEPHFYRWLCPSQARIYRFQNKGMCMPFEYFRIKFIDMFPYLQEANNDKLHTKSKTYTEQTGQKLQDFRSKTLIQIGNTLVLPLLHIVGWLQKAVLG